MNDKFYIKDGSFCFVIPFFTEGSDICDHFFEELQSEWKVIEENSVDGDRHTKKCEATARIKKQFVDNLRNANFPFVKTNLSCPIYHHAHREYNRKHLCQCVSSATKFHDDISQKNKSTQLYLDHYTVTYNYRDTKCKFDFNVLLYINHEIEGKISYVVIEINTRDIEGNLFDYARTPEGTLDPEYIIFIKHLFYKRKMTVNLQRRGKAKHKTCCLQDWITGYLQKLCATLGVSYLNAVPDYAKNAAFKYSFIELKELKGSYNQPISFDFDNMDRFLDTHSRFVYGLLLSDEGWRAVPGHIITQKLQDYWFTRKFCCTFFLQHSALLFNLKNSEDGKAYSEYGREWFSRYKDDKYTDYVTSIPCLTGIDTLTLFGYLKAIAKQVYIDKYKETMDKEERKEKELPLLLIPLRQLTFWLRSIMWREPMTVVSERLNKARENLELLTRILNSPSFMLGEIKGMEECIYRQFGIIDTIKYVQEIYQRQSDKLHFSYEISNNNTIKALTYLTAFIGILQLTNSKWWLTVGAISLVIASYIYYGFKLKWFRNKKNYTMNNDWIDKEIIYQVFVDRFAGFKEVKENGNHFIGGNIRGVIERLDYLQNMGITTIWLSPICRTANYHGYHISDFMKMDERFGTIEDLAELIELVHKRGMKIIADFVPNHCSMEHPYFQQALNDPNSKYRDWFFFNKKNQYKCFLKYKELPKLNLDNPGARKHLIDAARFWCAYGFDGLRIDHAVGPSFDFWNELYSTMKEEFPNKIFFGEVWCKGITRKYYRTLSLKNRWWKYLFGIRQESFQRDYIGVFDGLLDFKYGEILIDTVKKGERILNNPKLDARIEKHFSKYTKKTGKYQKTDKTDKTRNFKLLLFLDNHDTDRFLFYCNGDTSLLLEAIEFSRKQNRAFILYYGTEQAMMNDTTIFDGSDYADLSVREPMNWNQETEASLYDQIANILKKKESK